jgi:hypothetical protein
VASVGRRSSAARLIGRGTFNRKSRTALRNLERQKRIGMKRIDFQIVFAESANEAPRINVGNVEEDIVTASKFCW